jgi:glycosyltransferase involved in cell wall biosynthesis
MQRRVKQVVRAFMHGVAGLVTTTLYLLIVVPIARVSAWGRHRAGLRPRVVWGPIPIINIRYTSAADRAFGYPSETVTYDVYGINTRRDFDHTLSGLERVPLLRELVPYGAFLWAGLRYDIFGFFYDGGLLWATPWWRFELRLLKLAGKKILVYPYGSDARIPSVTRARGGWNAYSDVPVGAEDRDEAAVRARLGAFARSADVMLGCADLFEDLPRCDGIMRYAFDNGDWHPVVAQEQRTVRIVHAPNHRHYKGTKYLLEAVERLRAEGLDVDLDLVEGVPAEQARRIYEQADIVADQFLIGAYALFAIEGMALGKPVVCYLNPRFAVAHPEWAECPIVSATPDELTDRLRELVTDADLRRRLGDRGPEYVEVQHSLRSVGADLDRFYRQLWR